jgi:hypothetical protein
VTPSVSANGGNRCARRRSPRSPPTVYPEGKCSLDVQGNAHFRHSTLPLLHTLLTAGARESWYEATHRLDVPSTMFRPWKGCRHDQRCPRHLLQRQRRRRHDPRHPGQGPRDPVGGRGRWLADLRPATGRDHRHPATEGGRAELYLMCDDVAATVAPSRPRGSRSPGRQRPGLGAADRHHPPRRGRARPLSAPSTRPRHSRAELHPSQVGPLRCHLSGCGGPER